MKKPLLKPPEENNEIIFKPAFREFISGLRKESKVGICHQPYFFNPGISLKFIFLEGLPIGDKKIIFLDTDKVKLKAAVPSPNGIQNFDLIDSEEILFDYPMPDENKIKDFFRSIEEELRKNSFQDSSKVVSNFLNFREIFWQNTGKKSFKEVLVESFLDFFSLKKDYCFLSDFIKGPEFEDFFLKIYHNDSLFRGIFNGALDEYRNNFRFRYKNFPFPKLAEDELPFWVLKGGKRLRCFKKDLKDLNFKNIFILPRAGTLTMFLRVYKLDSFIHGIGGANYEWVQERVIEIFFKKTVPSYAVVSGTFLIDGFKERDCPYFLFLPEEIKERAYSFFKGSCEKGL